MTRLLSFFIIPSNNSRLKNKLARVKPSRHCLVVLVVLVVGGGGWWWVGLKPVRARVQAAGGEDGYSRRLWELDTKLKKGNQNGEEAKGA